MPFVLVAGGMIQCSHGGICRIPMGSPKLEIAGNKWRALLLYQSYLRVFGDQVTNADDVKRRIITLKQAIDAEIEVENQQVAPSFQVSVVNGPDVKAENDFGSQKVGITATTESLGSGSKVRYRFGPHSFSSYPLTGAPSLGHRSWMGR